MKFATVFVLFLVNGVFAGIDTDWWRYTTVYEIYIRSFKDSDGDGSGDIRGKFSRVKHKGLKQNGYNIQVHISIFIGITKKLDHFVDLGIETLYVSPFYTSPMRDMGYDISNYTAIDPVFGTMEEFDELVRELEIRGK